MPAPKARKRSKNSPGRRASAGHSFKLLIRPVLVMAVIILASSTISDPLQKLTDQGRMEAARIAGIDNFNGKTQQERLALLRRTAGDTDAVRHLSIKDLSLLFGEPSLKREEPEVVSWHFTSPECALDVYFPRKDNVLRNPVYAEYRVRGEVQETGIVEDGKTLDHKSCVKSLFSHARFPEQGTD